MVRDSLRPTTRITVQHLQIYHWTTRHRTTHTTQFDYHTNTLPTQHNQNNQLSLRHTTHWTFNRQLNQLDYTNGYTDFIALPPHPQQPEPITIPRNIQLTPRSPHRQRSPHRSRTPRRNHDSRPTLPRLRQQRRNDYIIPDRSDTHEIACTAVSAPTAREPATQQIPDTAPTIPPPPQPQNGSSTDSESSSSTSPRTRTATKPDGDAVRHHG